MTHKNATTPSKSHIRPDISEFEYEQINQIIDTLDVISGMTYQVIYIIDYYKNNFLYISNNPIIKCDEHHQTVLKPGLKFYNQICDKEELRKIEQINAAANLFWSKLDKEQKTKHILTYNFHIKNKLVHHKMCPIKLDNHGNIWLTLCTISLANSTDILKACIIHEKSHEIWEYDSDMKWWRKKQIPALDNNEKTILALSYAGMTLEQISEHLCKSPYSIKKYRHNIFSKLGTNNITETLAYAISKKLF